MFKKPLHHLLRKRRDSLDVTQAHVAKLAKIDATRYPKVERGELAPTPDEIEALCRVLQLEPKAYAVRPPRFNERLLDAGKRFIPDRKPFYPRQDRSNHIRFNAARANHRSLVRAMMAKIRKRPDFGVLNFFCEKLANDSRDENLFLLSVLVEGAQPCLIPPSMLGYFRHPIVDPVNKVYVGHHPFPALINNESLYFFQVSMATPIIYTVDCLQWNGRWSVIEIDGEGHDYRCGRQRTADIEYSVYRFDEAEVVDRCRLALGWKPMNSKRCMRGVLPIPSYLC